MRTQYRFRQMSSRYARHTILDLIVTIYHYYSEVYQAHGFLITAMITALNISGFGTLLILMAMPQSASNHLT